MRVSIQGDRLLAESGGPSDTDKFGRALAPLLRDGIVIGLVGDLGAGKTRLARAISEALGADPDAISSPTFVLVNEYDAEFPIRHADTYRLRNADEFEALGLSDAWLSRDGVCLIEWADRVRDRLPEDAWTVTISRIDAVSRHICLEAPREIIEALREALTD